MPEAYNSIHTGEQIDAGIATILNTDIPGLANQAKQSAADAKKSSDAASISATSAFISANNAKASEDFCESYAKGGTGTRPGEDTDNAKYYSELAAGSAAGIVGAMTFNGRSGNVVPEKGDYGVAQGVPILDETNKVPKELLPELGTNIPRSTTPPTDPETTLYIDTSFQNDSFYTAKEIDTKLNSLTLGSNRNFINNAWFQINNIRGYNKTQIINRWFVGADPDNVLKRAYISGNVLVLKTSPDADSHGVYSYISTRVFLSINDVGSLRNKKNTISILTSVNDGPKKLISFTFSLPQNTTIRSNIIDQFQFQVTSNWAGNQLDISIKYIGEEGSKAYIKAVKLESGEKSTLFNDAPNPYPIDELLCSKYFQHFSNDTWVAASNAGDGIVSIQPFPNVYSPKISYFNVQLMTSYDGKSQYPSNIKVGTIYPASENSFSFQYLLSGQFLPIGIALFRGMDLVIESSLDFTEPPTFPDDPT